ncbi:MAG: PAS domain S-box protein, partial [Syntrophales bacterium]
MAKKILIVDDDETSLDTLTSLVEEEGFEVSAAENGRDALDKAHANPPDLIVSDILMPVMDGYTLCRQWKSDEQLKYIPFVLYTAVYTEPKEETFSLSLGADRLIIKPQKPEILVNVVQEILDEKNRIKRPPPKPLGEEIEFFRRHNEILFSKLEKKISDLEIANQKLKALDEKYRLSFENASDVILTIDTDFTVSSISPSVERILGYKPQDFIGRLVSDIGFIFTPESLEQAMTDMSLVFTGETIPTTIYRLVARDGTLKFVEVSGSPIMHEGKIIGMISVARDITDRKQAEDKLRESEKKYRELYDFLPIPVYEMDLEANITSTNRAIFETFRVTEEDVKKGFKVWQILSPEDIDKSKKNIQRLLKGEQIGGTEYTLVRLDGSAFPAIVISSVIHSNGKPVGLRGAIVNITERRRAEETLKEREKRYRTILESIQEGYYELDLAGNYTFFNPSMAKILGYREEEMMGMNYRTFIVKESAEKVFRYFNQVYRTGRSSRVDYEQISGDGSKMSVETSIELMRDSFGKRIGFRGIVRDVTKRKQLEESKREADELFTQFMKYFPGSAYIKDSNRRIIQVTENVEKYFGVKPDEWLGKTSEEIWHPELAAQVRRDDEEVLQGRAVESITERPQKGGIHTWLTQRFPIHRQNKPPLIGCISIDITDRVKAEEALRESEEKYRSLAVTVDSMYLVDREYRYQFMNERHLSRLGMSLNEVIGRPYAEFHSEEDTKLFTGSGETVLESRKSLQTEHRSERDGRYFLRTFSPVKDSQDNVTAITVISKDITDRKMAEKRSDEALQFNRTILSASPVAILTYNSSGQCVSANEAASRIVGGTIEELLRQNFYELESWKRADMIDAAKNALMTGQVQILKTRILTTFGRDKWFDCRFAPFNYEGEPHLLLMVSDITDRKQAEELYSNLADSSHSGVYIVQDGKLQFVNPHVIEYSGYSENELLRTNIIKYVHPDDRELVRRNSIDMLTGKRSTPYEFRMIGQKGNVRWLLETVRSISYKEKPAVLGNTMDITDRKQAEEKIRESLIFQQHLIDALPAPLFYKDSKGIYLGCNKAFEQFFGTKRETITGKSDYDISPKELADIYREQDMALLQNTGEQIYESSVKDSHGLPHTVIFHKAAFPDVDGSVGGLIGVILDITKRKEAEEALRQAESDYRSIFENAQEAIYRSTLGGKFIVANQSLADMLGYDSPRDIINNINDISRRVYVNPRDREVLLRILKESGFVRNFECEFYRKDGSKIWVSMTVRNVCDSEGTVQYLEGIAQDISIRKLAEEEHGRSFERIRRALKATVEAIAVMVETRDPYTAGHQRRVSDLARAIATEMNLSTDKIDGIQTAAIIHDIGKISVPAEILAKPTELTDLEFGIIKTHAQSGYDILKDIEFPWPVARMVLEHHERMD